MDSYVRPEEGILYSCTALPDPWVADYVAAVVPPEDRVNTHNRAVATGYRAIAGAQANGGLMALSDQLQSSVTAAGEHADHVVKDLGEKIDSIAKAYLAPDGSFTKTFAGFEKAVGGKLDPSSPEMQKLRDKLESDYRKQAKIFLDEVHSQLNLADETSPMARIHRDVQAIAVKVAEVKTQLDNQALVQQARRATPLVAGRSLEEFVNQVIAPIASHHGETFDDVRDVLSTTSERRKVGDFVTTLDGRITRGAAARLVTEAKNRKSATVSALLKELNDGMQAREAIAAVGILTNPNAKCRPITAYEGNKVVISLPGFGDQDCDYEYFASLIELGYEYGRLLAAARATMTPTGAIDLESIVREVDEIEKAAKGFKELASNHTRILSAVESAQTTAGSIRDNLLTAASNLRDVLQSEIERVRRKELPPPASDVA
jgi:hypothetical protein